VWSDGKQEEPPSHESLKSGYDGFPLIEADDRIGRDINFFDRWLEHPKFDSYWRQINGDNRAESLVAPVFMMGGWYDAFLPGMLDDFVRIQRSAKPNVAKASRLIIGPWAHARNVNLPRNFQLRNYRLETVAPSLAWFDQHLENEKVSLSVDSPLRLFVMGKNIWRDEREWPLARAVYTAYYLRSDGKANSIKGDGTLELTPAVSSESSDTYVYDPRNPVPTVGGTMLGPQGGIALQNVIENRADVLIYTTPPLNNDLEVTGPIQLFLYVSTTAPSTDFTAKLVDVYPDESAYNISEGILRRDYKATDQPVEIQIDLWPTSIVFLKGHRIRLEVSSSNYPRFDRNPNTGRAIATEEELIEATQIIYHDQKFLSRLILPIIPEKVN
jgi:putative CocE/NonD family hydrolase